MWLFGNFTFGYNRIATSDASAFESLMRKTEARSPETFETRPDFRDIEEIAPADLSFLGYISSGELRDLDVAKKLVEALLENSGATAEVLANLGKEKQEKISRLLKTYDIPFPLEGTSGLSVAELTKILTRVSEIYDPLKSRYEKAVAIGKRRCTDI